VEETTEIIVCEWEGGFGASLGALFGRNSEASVLAAGLMARSSVW
jgi:hypothetical protein